MNNLLKFDQCTEALGAIKKIDPTCNQAILEQNESISTVTIREPIEVQIRDKEFYSDITFWISFLALLISGYSVYASKTESRRNRSDSINDHFWFREVLYPDALKPLNDFCNHISSTLPSDHNSKNTRKKHSDIFLKQFQNEQNEIHHKLLIVKLHDEKLHKSIHQCLLDIEDFVTTYCYKNSTDVTVDPNLRANTISNVNGLQTQILRSAKQSQSGSL